MLKVVKAPRVITIVLPTKIISINLVGSESKSIKLPASLAAWVPLFMANPTSACAKAGASLVPSPVMATKKPFCWYSRMRSNLSCGLALAK